MMEDKGETDHGLEEAQRWLDEFWSKTTRKIETCDTDFKHQELPLARIKKIMKLDEDVRMISQEAPMLFAKAAEIFISELAVRAYVQKEQNKRKTLQRSDISLAISSYDQFDFLIDIVPRESDSSGRSTRKESSSSQVQQYYFQAPQGQVQTIQLGQQPSAVSGPAPQVIQLQQPQGQSFQLTESQLQAIQQQLSGSAGGKPIILQTGQMQQGSQVAQVEVSQGYQALADSSATQ